MHRFSKFWVAAIVAAVVAGCTAEVEDTGEAPDINVEGGRAPDVDVNPAEVNVSTDTQTVVTPDVDVRPANP